VYYLRSARIFFNTLAVDNLLRFAGFFLLPRFLERMGARFLYALRLYVRRLYVVRRFLYELRGG